MESNEIDYEDLSIFNNEYEILCTLGYGKTSKVYKVKDIKDRKNLYALKVFVHHKNKEFDKLL